jgi:hypothetical protein
VVCADFNGDGWPDIFVANDGAPNHLWINQHNGTFTEEAVRCGVAYNKLVRAEAGMGVALGDVDGDGLFDLFVTHLTQESHTLWIQGPKRGLFQDRTAASRLHRLHWRGTGFGTVLADFNHDGAPDIVVVTGRIAKAPTLVNADLGPHWGRYAERNQLLANDGKGRFRDLSPHNEALCGTANVARGLACGDVFGKGTQDLLVTTVAGRARVYQNIVPSRGHWLLVRAIDPVLKRDAIGAEVRVRAGGRTRVGLINPGGSYLCSSDMRAHFGLGETDQVDEITVLWPDGETELFKGRRADQTVVLRKGTGTKPGTPREKRP